MTRTRTLAALTLAMALVGAAAHAQTARVPKDAVVFVEPSPLSHAITAALMKKKVPVRVTADRADAAYILAATTAVEKEGGVERAAKIVMLGMFAGSGKSRDTAVTVTDASTGIVVFAYQTRKGGDQSAAEGVAKNLKKHIEGK